MLSRSGNTRSIRLPDDEIYIKVSPGHVPYSEIDGPTSKEPMVKPCTCERVANLTDDCELCQRALIHNSLYGRRRFWAELKRPAANTRDDSRNALIVQDVLNVVRQGRSPLILTERIDHLDIPG